MSMEVGSATSDATSKRKLQIVVCLALLFAVVQFVGGLLSGSLAILADAVHMLSDLTGFIVALAALLLAGRPASVKFTYGLHRAEVLGAVLSISIMYILTGVLVSEAVERLQHPARVDSLIMLVTAAVGIFFNIVLVLVLGGDGHDHSHGHSHGHGHTRDDGHRAQHDHGHGHAHIDDHGAGHDHGADHGVAACAHDHAHDHQPASRHGGGRVGDVKTESQAHNRHDARAAVEPVAAATAAAAATVAVSETPAPLQKSLAVRAAMAHALGDLLQSVGLLAAATLIYSLEDRWLDEDGLSYWLRVDPICTLLFAVLVVLATWQTAKDCVLVLMCAVPPGIDARSIYMQLRAIPGIVDVRCARARARPCAARWLPPVVTSYHSHGHCLPDLRRPGPPGDGTLGTDTGLAYSLGANPACGARRCTTCTSLPSRQTRTTCLRTSSGMPLRT